MTKLTSKDYEGKPHGCRQGQTYQQPSRIGYYTLIVLPQLNGKCWNEYALALVHSLRPSHIRVVTDSAQLDAQTWRITVWVDHNNIIKQIEQEVEVGLPDDCEYSIPLMRKLNL